MSQVSFVSGPTLRDWCHKSTSKSMYSTRRNNSNERNQMLFGIARWLRSANSKLTFRPIYVGLSWGLKFLAFLYCVDQYSEHLKLTLAERLSKEMLWQDKLLSLENPSNRMILAFLLSFILPGMLAKLVERTAFRISSLLFEICGKNGIGEALYFRAEDLIDYSDRPVDYTAEEEQQFLARFEQLYLIDLYPIKFFKAISLEKYVGVIVESLENRKRKRVAALQMRALELLRGITSTNQYYGQGMYLAAMIGLRGLVPTNERQVIEKLEVAADANIDHANFELALLLCKSGDPKERIKSIGIFKRILPNLESDLLMAVALYEVARQMSATSKYGDLIEARKYINKLLDIQQHSSIVFRHDNHERSNEGKLAKIFDDGKYLRDKISAAIELSIEREKREISENLMAMFAHKFRGPVDSIIFNTEHQHDERLYIEAARTMNGLLEIFSVVSTTPDKLGASLSADKEGNGSPMQALIQSLTLALMQLLSQRNRRRMSPHYLAYAKAHEEAPSDLRLSAWCDEDEWGNVESRLQKEWECGIGALAINAKLENLTEWMGQHLVRFEANGFNESGIRFASYGSKASLLIVILTEFIVNAIKHSSPQPSSVVKISLHESDDFVELRCENRSSFDSRTREASKGNGRGQKFLRLIADHMGGEFVVNVLQDNSNVSMLIPTRLMKKE